jgi:toxin ParE1/3/4
MTYRTTKRADEDIIDLYVRGVQDFGNVAAERYIDGLFSTFEMLAENPHMARERGELNPPVRLHPYGSHIVAYVPRDHEILIVRVLHNRRNWQSLLV